MRWWNGCTENHSENRHFRTIRRERPSLSHQNYPVLKLVVDYRDTRGINTTIISLEMYISSPLEKLPLCLCISVVKFQSDLPSPSTFLLSICYTAERVVLLKSESQESQRLYHTLQVLKYPIFLSAFSFKWLLLHHREDRKSWKSAALSTLQLDTHLKVFLLNSSLGSGCIGCFYTKNTGYQLLHSQWAFLWLSSSFSSSTRASSSPSSHLSLAPDLLLPFLFFSHFSLPGLSSYSLE